MSGGDLIPPGYCHCGCGKRTPLAQRHDPKRGHVKGQPTRFCMGHRRNAGYVEEDRGYLTPCWIWQGGTHSGYGRVIRHGRSVLVHRHNYEVANGPLPVGVQVHHRCEQPLCVRADHLEALTPLQHRRRHAQKLTLEDARDIRRDPAPARDVANAYGVDASLISRIRSGALWPEGAAA